MTIKEIHAYQILDSRGEPTLAVRMVSDTGNEAMFGVPTGKSVGEKEAIERRDGEGGSYRGYGVSSCVEIIDRIIGHKFVGYPLGNQFDFDSLLLALDGTIDKSNLGANTVLGMSGAYFKLSAREKGLEPWEYVKENAKTNVGFPRIFANVINGGKHAPGLTIQEFMIVPKSNQPHEAIEQIYEYNTMLHSILGNLYGPSARLVADEGGMAPIGITTESVLEVMSQLASKFSGRFELALDVAASSFYDAKTQAYTLDGQSMTSQQLLEYFQTLDKKYRFFALEDLFDQNDLEAYGKVPHNNKVQQFLVVGDDVTVTSKEKIEQVAQKHLVDAVIIKPNQVGTISETLEAIETAKRHNLKIIVSHRSGETNDDFIADLAYGIGAMGIKIGAPVRGERVAKYNRLIEIERDVAAREATQPAPTAPKGHAVPHPPGPARV